jgi:hypothetical protein
MAKYKVKTLAVSGRNNKVYRNGDTIDGSAFAGGETEAKKLVESGHILPLEPEKKTVKKTETKKETFKPVKKTVKKNESNKPS